MLTSANFGEDRRHSEPPPPIESPAPAKAAGPHCRREATADKHPTRACPAMLKRCSLIYFATAYMADHPRTAPQTSRQ